MQHRTFTDPIPLPQFPSHRSSCTLCPLHLVAKHVGIGLHHLPESLPISPSHPALLVVGQNPGYHENACGTPFVGKSGQVLQSVYLDAAKLHNAASIYVTNTARCFHVHGNDPPNSAYKTCAPYLIDDIRHLFLTHPAVTLLMLGAPAVTYGLGVLAPSLKKPNLSMLLARQGLSLPFPPPAPPPKKTRKKSTPPIPPPAPGDSPASRSTPVADDRSTTDGRENGRGVTVFATYHPAYMLRDLNAAHAIGGHIHLLDAHLRGTMPLPSRPNFRRYCEPPQPARDTANTD